MLAAAVAAAASGLAAEMRATVGRVACAPTVDGRRDACYAESFPIAGFSRIATLRPSSLPTELRLVHDGTRLYGFFACDHDATRDLAQMSSVRRDPNIWRNDSLELFFRTDDGMRYYALSPGGGVHWIVAHQDDANLWVHDKVQPDSGIVTAVSRERDNGRWYVEFSIPLAELPGREWSVNVVRNNVAGETVSWEPCDRDSWWDPRQPTGVIRLSDAPLGGSAMAALPVFDAGRNFTLAVTNDAGEVAYRFVHRIPERYARISPANLCRGILFLDGGKLSFPSRLSWNSRHNYPDVRAQSGNSAAVGMTIRFKVPDGVTVTSGRRIGSCEIGGKGYGIFEQVSPRIYNAPHWLVSTFTCSLPDGSEGEILYGTTCDGRHEAEKPIRFRVSNIPEVTPPKRYVAAYDNLNVDGIEDARRYARIGVNTFSVPGYRPGARRLAKDLASAGFQVRHGDYFWIGAEAGENGNHAFEKWAVDDASAQALDIDGKPIALPYGLQLSPSYRGRLYREAIGKEIAFQRETGVDWCAFDMEGYIQRKGENGDFRPETVAAFGRRWTKRHPGTAVPDPLVFEREPGKHPLEHREWVETKCELWGAFFREMRAAISEGVGRSVRFTEWSMNAIADVEARNHSLRNADFFREFDAIELDLFAGVDRDLRQLARKIGEYRREFPGLPLRILANIAPIRLGEIDGPGTYYCTTAPQIENENLYMIMESLTMGAKGVAVFKINTATADSMRQFAEGMAIVNRVEDLVMDGTPFELTSDFPADAKIADKFFGREQVWENEPRVFTRGISLGDRTLISVSEYRELKPITVKVNYTPRAKVRATDVETGEALGVFGSSDHVLPVTLGTDRRCRLILLEPVP